MPIRCPNCHTEFERTPRFCPNCGERLDAIGVQERIQGWEDTLGTGQPSHHHGKPVLRLRHPIVVVSLIFGVIVIAYGIYSLVDMGGLLSPMGGLSGTWVGSGSFTNGGVNCGNPACSYEGSLNPPSVILEIQQNGNMVFGTITINIPDATPLLDQPCPGFDNSQSNLYNGVLSGNRLTFADIGSNIWTLNFINGICTGNVDSNNIGCTGLKGTIRLTKQ